jgi:NAD(P)-dependent dehydrogenase (short-subunit alcohol dehydrogenase family)
VSHPCHRGANIRHRVACNAGSYSQPCTFADNSSGNNYGYRASKATVNMIGMNLRHDLTPAGVAVALLHPRLVATDMTRGTGVSPADAARGLIARMDERNLDSKDGGVYIF